MLPSNSNNFYGSNNKIVILQPACFPNSLCSDLYRLLFISMLCFTCYFFADFSLCKSGQFLMKTITVFPKKLKIMYSFSPGQWIKTR